MTKSSPPPAETIAIFWHLQDVISIRPDLTLEQAAAVLQSVLDNHDAAIGVNWDVLERCAESLVPESCKPNPMTGLLNGAATDLGIDGG